MGKLKRNPELENRKRELEQLLLDFDGEKSKRNKMLNELESVNEQLEKIRSEQS